MQKIVLTIAYLLNILVINKRKKILIYYKKLENLE